MKTTTVKKPILTKETFKEIDLRNLDSAISEKQKELDKLIKARKSLHSKSFKRCDKEKSEYSGLKKWDYKKCSIVDASKVGCGTDVLKENFFYVGVEEYSIEQCGTDAGYGECDEFRWEHVYSIYEVCGNAEKRSILNVGALNAQKAGVVVIGMRNSCIRATSDQTVGARMRNAIISSIHLLSVENNTLNYEGF